MEDIGMRNVRKKSMNVKNFWASGRSIKMMSFHPIGLSKFIH
jgi:hypothetical protein